jgi:hypothetical protein
LITSTTKSREARHCADNAGIVGAVPTWWIWKVC